MILETVYGTVDLQATAPDSWEIMDLGTGEVLAFNWTAAQVAEWTARYRPRKGSHGKGNAKAMGD